jgi:hypothetical protein
MRVAAQIIHSRAAQAGGPPIALACDLPFASRKRALFGQPALAAAKAQINKRAGVPSGEDLLDAVTVFR